MTRRPRVRERAFLVATAVALALALNACGSSSKSTTAATAVSSAASPATGGCAQVAAPRPKAPQHLRPPTLRLAANKTYTVKLTTNCGGIDIRLDVARAPKTSASFASLVRRGFYNMLTFHRIAPGFVIQGGDPLGTGAGGPGYTIVERPPAGLRYTRDVVAMAKTATEASGTSGSQFFIVTGADAQLPPQFALVGRVIKGDGAVNQIAGVPTAGPTGEAPVQPVVIERATLVVS